MIANRLSTTTNTPMIAGTYSPGGGRGGSSTRTNTRLSSECQLTPVVLHVRKTLQQLRFVLVPTFTQYYCDVKQSHDTRPHHYGHCCVYYSVSYTTKAYHYLFYYSRREISQRCRGVCYLANTTGAGRRMEMYTGVYPFVYGGGYDLSR